MKKLRWTALFLAAALLASLFTGCAQPGAGSAVTGTTATASSAGISAATAAPAASTTSAATAAGIYDPAADYPYGVGMSPFFQNFTPTENGYYMLVNWFLFYMDADAMEPVPVCNRPNCMHYYEPEYKNFQACSAYWNSANPITNTLSYCNGKLWFIAGVETVNDPTNPFQYAVMRMDPDGMNREIVYRIDPTQTVPKAILHRGVYYFYTRAWNQEARQMDQLYALDLSNPRREPECIFSTEDRGGLQAFSSFGSPCGVIVRQVRYIVSPMKVSSSGE